jgi:DNA-binding NtrC family response regulator
MEEASTAVAPRPAAPVAASFVLTVIEGPDQGRRCGFDATQPAPLLIGQGPACRLQLTDRHVSRRHAALDVTDGRVRITDLGSTNGTFVDGVRILDAMLREGEIVRVGSTALRLDVAALDPPATFSGATRFGRLIGESVEMRRLYSLLERLAASTIPVVIEGETGTGKELLAEAVHETGPRAAGPYVVFDCTAVPPNLIESELFGHERGAFTGAAMTRRGMFEQAHGGTLLIDEIGDLQLELQPKLLRAIERGEIRRVGGERPIRVDVRLLAATRRDLDREVQMGRFRDDLFHRLAVGRVELPPLRRRGGDVTLLAQHFWRELGGQGPIVPELLLRWEEHSWPGNVRELRNTVARQLALGDLGAMVPLSERPPRPQQASDGAAALAEAVVSVLEMDLPLPVARLRVVEEFERAYIARALVAHGDDVARAAGASGIGRRYFQMLRSGKRRR